MKDPCKLIKGSVIGKKKNGERKGRWKQKSESMGKKLVLLDRSKDFLFYFILFFSFPILGPFFHCPGTVLGIIGQNSSVSKITQFHVDMFRVLLY